MKKRILSLCLVLCLTLSLLPILPVGAYGDDDIAYPVTGGNIYFDKLTGTVTGCDETITSANIPAEIDGVAVTTIGYEAFARCISLTEVTIPDSVTTIGGGAFWYCDSLTEVTIGDSVTTIGDYAFAYCDSLTEVTIPDSVTTIGEHAFSYCDSLKSIEVSGENPDYSSKDGVLFDKKQTILYQYPGGKEGAYEIPGGVTTIGNSAFEDCGSLTVVTIPNSVTTIGDDAFYYCDSLTAVTIGDSVTTIGDYAFYWCGSLTSITIPDSVTTIGDSAFLCCDSLTAVTIGDSVTTIGDSAFLYCVSLTAVTIPDSVTTIGEWAFCECDSLTAVTIGDSVTTIGEDAFYGCDSLTEVTIGDSVTTIGEWAFGRCDSLTKVTIGDSVTTIGDKAFSSCDSLKSIEVSNKNPNYSSKDGVLFDKAQTLLYQCPGGKAGAYEIPDSVTTIGNSAFEDCGSLTVVTIPNSVTTIGDSAFSYCNDLTEVMIPGSVLEIGEQVFFECISLSAIEVAPENTAYSSEDGVLFNKEKTTLVQYPMGKDGGYYAIPRSITSIGKFAFMDCRWLWEVTIPDSVTEICDGAFEYCSALNFVAIPHSVTTIGNGAFSNCDSLNTLVISDGVETIGDGAFCCDSLRSIHIPESVSMIGDYAFSSNNDLNSVYFDGNAPTVGEEPFSQYGALTLYYISGKEGWTSPTWNGYHTETWDGKTGVLEIYALAGGNLYFDTASGTIIACDKTVTAANIPAEIGGVAVTTLGERAFSSCTSLTEVTIPNSVTTIGDSAFSSCTSLTEVTIPNSVTTIGSSAFGNCDGLTSVTIPNGVTTISQSAFASCSELSYVVISDSVSTMESWVFVECPKLTSAYFLGDAPEVGGALFGNDPVTIYYIEGKSGWTSPTWNGYPTATWDGTTFPTPDDPIPEGVIAYPVEGGNIYFYKATGTVTGCDETITSANIPAEIDGVAVTAIGEAALSWCPNLTAVTIPDSVTTIGGWAFNNCHSLAEVTIGDNVTAIGEDAFYNCTSLTEVTIPNSVTTIGYEAFFVCTGLTAATIPDSVTTIGEHAFSYCDSLKSIEVSGENPNYSSKDGVLFNKAQTTLYQCPGGKAGAYEIPGSVTTIGEGAFTNCNSLTAVTIPNSVTTIGDRAFEDCDSLTAVTIPNSVTTIGDEVFAYCNSLTAVTIPNSVTTIGEDAFWHCYNLAAVTIGDSVTTIGNYAFFGCDSLTGVYFRGDAPELGDNVFSIYDEESDEDINNPNLTLYYIEGKSGWTSPTWNGYPTATWDGTTIPTPDVPVPGSAITYPVEGGNIYFDKSTGTVTGCDDSVTRADIPERIDGVAVTAIGDLAFSWCSSLTEVTIPNRVTTIGDYAFVWCSSLTAVTIGDSVTTISNRAFESCDNLKSIEVSSENPNYSSKDGVLFNKAQTTLYQCPGGKAGAYEIPNSVTAIGDRAFNTCRSLTAVTIPDSVTTIGGGAFWYCDSLTEVTIGDSVTTIGDSAFVWCNSLTAVTIPDSVTTIGDSAFTFCSSLKSIEVSSANQNYSSKDGVLFNKTQTTLYQYPASKAGAYEIPGSVTMIGKGAFGNCYSLTVVTIPDSVTTIGDSAFGGCTNLTTVTIPDSVTTIDAAAFYDCIGLTSVYFTGDAPELGNGVFSIYDGESGKDINNPNLTLYYIEGKSGWTSPTWNGYPTATWDGTTGGIVAYPVEGGNIYFDKATGTITDCDDSVSRADIPAEIDGVSVTTIGDHAFGGCTSLTELTIGDSVTTISDWAFCDCTNLTTVTIGDSVTTISDWAFCNCYSLTTVTIPDSVTTIGDRAFHWCDNLTAVYFLGDAPELGDDVFSILNNGYIINPNVTLYYIEGKSGWTTPTWNGYPTATWDGPTVSDPCENGHTWSAWTVSKVATCTAAGEETRTCSVCGEAEVREVKALGHDYQNGVCTRCGEKDPNAEVTPPSVPSFTDVPADAWYMDAVNYAVKNGLMEGTGNGKFEPDTVTTRAMIVTVLWRQAGKEKGDKNTFSDVPDGEWYTDAVAWAAANDIVKGTGNGKFEPAGDVTREQMVTILYRYCGNQGIDTSKTADLTSFPDAGQVNGYALDAMRWAVAEGIINGKVLDASGTTYLQPLGNASRAEIATILMRFIENILK